MKRTNVKFRSNGNNNGHSSQVYSLNYRFDSNSIAGKVNGTALELIKKYNELAKDAMNNSDVVTAELFRQYAEHYRKIVTDINEKKNSNPNNGNHRPYNNRRDNENSAETSVVSSDENVVVENSSADVNNAENIQSEASSETKNKSRIVSRKSFKVVEIKEENKNSVEKETAENGEEKAVAKPRRIYKKKVLTAEAV
ncbi:MAG: DUF4167 domain-containing protein [Alphaproteobacteria bacterium]